jgi:hypothetical protein
MITLATLICCGEPDWAEMPQTDGSFRRNTGILKRRFEFLFFVNVVTNVLFLLRQTNNFLDLINQMEFFFSGLGLPFYEKKHNRPVGSMNKGIFLNKKMLK